MFMHSNQQQSQFSCLNRFWLLLEILRPHKLLDQECKHIHRLLNAYHLTPTVCRQESPEGRLKEAQENGDSVRACVQQKHFARSLQSSQYTQPAQLLCGITEGGFVHFMFVYRNPLQDSASFDDSMSISYSLPVRDE